MAIESAVISPSYTPFTTNNHETLLYLAQGISGTTNYEIIDSYTNLQPPLTPVRHIGDPIADSIWVTPTDVGESNSWIIFQPTSPTHTPAWQAKLQCNNRYTGIPFADPSGNDYGFEGDTEGNVLWRFSPYGGWSFDMGYPDFDVGVDPDTEVSGNFRTALSSNQSAKILLTCDQDTITFFSRQTMEWQYYLRHFYYFGDYVPKTASQAGASARLAFGAYDQGSSFYLNEDTGLLVEDDPFYENLPTAGIWAWFLFPSGVGQRRRFTTIPMQNWMNVRSQPNRLVTPYSLDLAPMRLCGCQTVDDSSQNVHLGYEGILGDLRLYAKTFSPGVGTRFGGNEWLALGYQYSAAVRWDGTVDPF